MRRVFDRESPRARTYGLKATAAEANAVLSSVGNPVTDASDNTFLVIFDEPLGTEDDYFITVDVDGHEYGVTAPASDRKPTVFKLYFQLTDGKQTDFLDGEKVEDPETAKLDLSDFAGYAVMSVYRTDKQSEGTYPTGLSLVKRKRIRISNRQ